MSPVEQHYMDVMSAQQKAFGYFELIQSNINSSLHLSYKQQDSVKM
jgi:hypothetical protein